MGDALIGLGQLTDEDAGHHPATFVRRGEDWTVVPLADAPYGSSVDGAAVVQGKTIVDGWWGARAAQWTLSADGALDQTYLADDFASRGRTIDLGDGALLAAGWIDRPAVEERGEEQAGIGSCLWASLDGGATWDATMLPGQDGRFPGVSLIAEGENVLALLDDPDLPRGYRVVQARADVLGGEEESG